MIQFCAVAILLVANTGAMAAMVSATSRLGNAFNADSTCGNGPTRACDRLLNQPLSTQNPEGILTEVVAEWSFVATGNDTGVPNFINSGSVGASAVLGTLRSFVELEITGAGGGANPPTGITGIGEVLVKDAIDVRASGLPNGTPVTLRAFLDVHGDGGGELSLSVRAFGSGVSFFNSSVKPMLQQVSAHNSRTSRESLSPSSAKHLISKTY